MFQTTNKPGENLVGGDGGGGGVGGTWKESLWAPYDSCMLTVCLFCKPNNNTVRH